MGYLDLIPGLGMSNVARNAYLRVNKVPHFPPEWRERVREGWGKIVDGLAAQLAREVAA